MRRLLTTTPRRYHQVATAALILLTVIVFSGAAVRLTGSGLGCSGWPACEKGQIVAPLQTHAIIEFTNRVFSGIVAIGTIAAGLLAFFRVPPRRDLKILGMLLPLGVVAQAVLGGLSVVYDLKPGYASSRTLKRAVDAYDQFVATVESQMVSAWLRQVTSLKESE